MQPRKMKFKFVQINMKQVSYLLDKRTDDMMSHTHVPSATTHVYWFDQLIYIWVYAEIKITYIKQFMLSTSLKEGKFDLIFIEDV